MRLGIFIDLTNTGRANLANPLAGTNGTGAADYLLGLTAYLLHDTYEVILYTSGHVDVPVAWTKVVLVNTGPDAVKQAHEEKCDLFIYRLRQIGADGILAAIDTYSLPAIGRADLNPHPKHLLQLARSKNFKAIVCVGRYQYDQFEDHPIAPKRLQINNFLRLTSCLEAAEKVNKEHKTVCFLGAIVPQKAFHILAEAWPKIVKRHPDAMLKVLGSAGVYFRDFKAGPLGIAHHEYEMSSLVPHLCDSSGNLLPSVQLLGQVTEKKYELLAKATVGVVNPLGKTETCCVSAFEIEACGTPVVTGRYNALIYTVENGETGLLGKSSEDLANDICNLLENPTRAQQMGKNGQNYALRYFSDNEAIKLWKMLIYAIETGNPRPAPQFDRKNNIGFLMSLIRLNALLQHTVGKVLPWPSVESVRFRASKYWFKLKYWFNLK